MAAFRITTGGPSTGSRSPVPTRAAAASAQAPSAASATEPVTSAGSAPSAAAPDARAFTIKVTTDPLGASVREDATELCAPTPCDVTFKGEAADASRAHKLVVSHPGFRAETRTVKLGDPPVHVKLSRGGAAGAPGRPPPPSAKPTADTTPSGFKDVPY